MLNNTRTVDPDMKIVQILIGVKRWLPARQHAG